MQYSSSVVEGEYKSPLYLNASGPVCPGDIWTMQLMIEFVSIDLLTILSVQDNSGGDDEEPACSESTLPVHVAPI